MDYTIKKRTYEQEIFENMPKSQYTEIVRIIFTIKGGFGNDPQSVNRTKCL